MGGRANFEGRGRIFPESVRAVDGCILDAASVLARVRVSEVVFTVRVVREVCCEERRVQRGLGIVEKSGLWCWGNYLVLVWKSNDQNEKRIRGGEKSLF